jgi:glyoxylase-like metal-dependent hydrolase (beta-lactamase superfamily II)
MQMTATSTPGHTFTHLSYPLRDASPEAADGGVRPSVGVFSGGSLHFGATGRPDLLGEEHTHDLARQQHASAHKLADLLPQCSAGRWRLMNSGTQDVLAGLILLRVDLAAREAFVEDPHRVTDSTAIDGTR